MLNADGFDADWVDADDCKENQSKRKKKKKLTTAGMWSQTRMVVNTDGCGGTVDDSACVQGEFGLRDFVRAATIPY